MRLIFTYCWKYKTINENQLDNTVNLHDFLNTNCTRSFWMILIWNWLHFKRLGIWLFFALNLEFLKNFEPYKIIISRYSKKKSMTINNFEDEKIKYDQKQWKTQIWFYQICISCYLIRSSSFVLSSIPFLYSFLRI